jgi:hypothetical protein
LAVGLSPLCGSRKRFQTENGDVWDIKRVVVGYDDLVYTTATGMSVILQHGKSWTFECRYKLNGKESGDFNPHGNPEIVDQVDGEKELVYEMTINDPVIDISPSTPLRKFNITVTMEKYGDSWLHLQQCDLIGEDGGFQEIIVKDGYFHLHTIYK